MVITKDIRQIEKELSEKFELIKTCRSYGHISSGGSLYKRGSRLIAYDQCRRCLLFYERPPNSKEIEAYNRIMKTECNV